MARFFNRKKEIKFLNNWFKSEPNGILFVYGPKSCGKTTLITKVIENLNTKYYTINYLDLRGLLIYDFESFINTFFQKSKAGKLRTLIEGLTINTGFFTIGINEEQLLKKNPFKVMEEQLETAVKNGKKPVIILDEVHLLKSIYLNGQRHLLDELFNFFVRLTKVRHLAHIVLSTSNSYFVEELYRNAKLKKTTNFFFVNHFSKEDVALWLSQESVSLSNVDIEYIWKKLGGSVWEIKETLRLVKSGQAVKEAVQVYLDDEYGKFIHFINFSQFKPQELDLIGKVHTEIAKKGKAYLNNFSNELAALIPNFVEQEIWFYQADEQKLTANSESIRWAIKKSLK